MMKLLDEVVDLLSSKSGSLTDAMLKTKVLMHNIGHKDLAEWVNDELNGYNIEKTVPTYRVVPSRLVGNLRNSAWFYQDQTLPTGHLSEKQRKHFSENEMRESIHVLEEFAAKPKGHLIHPIAPELYAKLGEGLDGVWVERAWVQMEPTQIMNVLIEVRSRLLDFILNLRGELGNAGETDMKEAAKDIDAEGIFAKAVFGNHTTIQIGSNNIQNVTNHIKKGDFNSLAKELEKHGVEKEDLTELQIAINKDPAIEPGQTKLGPAVEGWKKRMWGKVVDTSWNVETGIAAGLLTDGLKAFYGTLVGG